MKHPYISGPMSNLPHHNYPTFFRCEAELEHQGYHPINPARRTPECTWESASQAVVDNPESWESCIRRDVEDVLKSDGIVLLPNWKNSRGACLELVLSISIGNTVAVWFAGQELRILDNSDLHYDTALTSLKRFGVISPLDMYNPSRSVLY